MFKEVNIAMRVSMYGFNVRVIEFRNVFINRNHMIWDKLSNVSKHMYKNDISVCVNWDIVSVNTFVKQTFISKLKCHIGDKMITSTVIDCQILVVVTLKYIYVSGHIWILDL